MRNLMAVSDRDAARRDVGQQLRTARRSAGFTQSDLSDRSGVGLKTIARCEQGTMAVTLDVIARLASVLNADLTVSARPPEEQEESWLIDADPAKEDLTAALEAADAGRSEA